jgi:hypothetical protein
MLGHCDFAHIDPGIVDPELTSATRTILVSDWLLMTPVHGSPVSPSRQTGRSTHRPTVPGHAPAFSFDKAALG